MALGTALAIGGIGAKLLGGLFGKKTAKSAAQVQQDAAKLAGQNALKVVADTNPAVMSAADTAATDARNTAEGAATGVDLATTNANALLNPYATAGAGAADVLGRGVAEGGDFNRMPTQADIMIDPGFDFRYGNAVKDFESFAGAHGGVDNGGALRDFETFRQGTRSQEFAAAYDRFLRSSQTRFSNVFNVAGMGQQAAGTQGSNLIGSATYGGNIRNQATQYGGDRRIDATNLTTGRTIGAQEQANEFATQGANANAAGKVAGSNALWSGINGAVDGATEAYYLSKNPNMFSGRWGGNAGINPAAPTRSRIPDYVN
jgi:hypothetical protein